MADPTVDAQINSLSWLIPTGENDIAVREVLIPIFGNAVSCKVPGAPCTTSTADAVSGVVANSGELVATIFNVFNAGTLVFCTVLLIFIALIGFVKTANDGEFFGQSWNTTFSMLRLVAGIGFILPMPNNYSTIQNFTLYVGLWSSGFANQVNDAASDHYLKRMASNLKAGEANAASVEREARDILQMHLCYSLAAQTLRPRGGRPPNSATLTPAERAAAEAEKSANTADLKMARGETMGIIDRDAEKAAQYRDANNLGSDENRPGKFARLTPEDGTLTEAAYLEYGNYFPIMSTPCGRLVIAKRNQISAADAKNDGVTSDIPESSWGSQSNNELRKYVAEQIGASGNNAHQINSELLDEMLRPNQATSQAFTTLASLAAGFTKRYVALNITYNPDGTVEAAPVEKGLTLKDSEEFISAYATIVKELNQKKLDSLKDYRNKQVEGQNESKTPGAFIAKLKALLQEGGWMGAASTYRTMLDMTALRSVSESQHAYQLQGVGTDEDGAFFRNLRNLSAMVNGTLDSDTAKNIYEKTAMNPQGVMPRPAVTEQSVGNMIKRKASMGDVMETFYGGGILHRMRMSILKTMLISPDYEPLFQIKYLGDRLTQTSEILIAGEMAARGGMSLMIISEKAAGAATLIPGVGAWAGVVEALRYLSDSLFSLTRTMASGLAILAYGFSTWIPAIPFVAFLLAQMGWLFGLIMTLFAMNLWGVMHVTPASRDSFIGSEMQGYLLLLALFFRPAIATAALSLSFVIAPPVMKLINITFITMMTANSASTDVTTVFLQIFFGLILYMVVVKGAIMMIYMIPQSFPDDVMKIISAGIGDLGQSKAMSTMEAGEGSGRAVQQGMDGLSKAGSDRFKGLVEKKKEQKKAAAEDATAKKGIKELSGTRPPNTEGQ
jgi:conjugal transfer/type IV secretion protein DotA/TraY